jgi:hypothetical protein
MLEHNICRGNSVLSVNYFRYFSTRVRFTVRGLELWKQVIVTKLEREKLGESRKPARDNSYITHVSSSS